MSRPREAVPIDEVDMSRLLQPLVPKPAPIPPRWYQILIDAGEREAAERLLAELNLAAQCGEH